jgi:hypothetical protein
MIGLARSLLVTVMAIVVAAFAKIDPSSSNPGER